MITKYSKEFIKNMIKDGIASPKVLRDYEVIKDRERGLTIGQIAIRHQLHRTTVMDILQNKVG